MTYVIFRLDQENRKEVYVDMFQHLKSTLVEVTDDLQDAKRFETARQAYEWAGSNGCDWWRVGKR